MEQHERIGKIFELTADRMDALDLDVTRALDGAVVALSSHLWSDMSTCYAQLNARLRRDECTSFRQWENKLGRQAVMDFLRMVSESGGDVCPVDGAIYGNPNVPTGTGSCRSCGREM